MIRKKIFPFRQENNAFYFISLARESIHQVEPMPAALTRSGPGVVPVVSPFATFDAFD
jgi:hypothetical protein